VKAPEHPLVVIAGSIGTGKTTLATILRDRFEMAAWLERPDLNPHLRGLYEDPARWAYEAHEVFLDHALARLRDAGGAGRTAVVERSPHETVSVFARMLREMDYISAARLAHLHERLDAAAQELAGPSLLIFLHAPVAELLARIRLRAWDAERVLSAGYLVALERAYARFVSEWSWCPVLRIDTSAVDLRVPANVERVLRSTNLTDRP
jgi:deoxyadenosine/deoxycytidine kinase